MELRKIIAIDCNPGEFIAEDLSPRKGKYLIRMNVGEVVEYFDDYLYIPDKFIKDKIKELYKEYSDIINLRDIIEKNYYLVFYIDSNSLYVDLESEINGENAISYNEWVIKRVLE